jgi:hypothetical protein
MIQARELRIGNWIENYKKEIVFIDKFSNQESYFTHDGDCYSILKSNPIPITEEWLIRFGFVKDGNGNHWIDLQTHYLEFIYSIGHLYPVYAQIPEMSNEDEQRVGLNRIQSVHQLQNLYFALKSEELQFKPMEG